ncbi:MAG: hypothetical protein QF864_12840, partial [SAR202 cluster bacterium]|nr:hypothetical protein [SAR202 cluster bacterium]
MEKQRKNMYWAQPQEQAIKDYIASDSITERHDIYINIIQDAFKKLIENIFYTFNFNKILGDKENIEHDLLIHLYERICKFKPERGTKSFSFFGTTVKNWFIQRTNAAKKKIHIDEDAQIGLIQTLSINEYKVKKKSEEDI